MPNSNFMNFLNDKREELSFMPSLASALDEFANREKWEKKLSREQEFSLITILLKHKKSISLGKSRDEEWQKNRASLYASFRTEYDLPLYHAGAIFKERGWTKEYYSELRENRFPEMKGLAIDDAYKKTRKMAQIKKYFSSVSGLMQEPEEKEEKEKEKNYEQPPSVTLNHAELTIQNTRDDLEKDAVDPERLTDLPEEKIETIWDAQESEEEKKKRETECAVAQENVSQKINNIIQNLKIDPTNPEHIDTWSKQTTLYYKGRFGGVKPPGSGVIAQTQDEKKENKAQTQEKRVPTRVSKIMEVVIKHSKSSYQSVEHFVNDIDQAKSGSWWGNPLSFLGRQQATRSLYEYEINDKNRGNPGLDKIKLFDPKKK